MPDATCIQKPTQIKRYSLLRGANGRSGGTPRIRKSIRTLAPTSKPMPIAWNERINQYANTESDSRIHTLRPVCSITLKTGRRLKISPPLRLAPDLQMTSVRSSTQLRCLNTTKCAQRRGQNCFSRFTIVVGPWRILNRPLWKPN